LPHHDRKTFLSAAFYPLTGGRLPMTIRGKSLIPPADVTGLRTGGVLLMAMSVGTLNHNTRNELAVITSPQRPESTDLAEVKERRENFSDSKI
jgi:hypothetical protein